MQDVSKRLCPVCLLVFQLLIKKFWPEVEVPYPGHHTKWSEVALPAFLPVEVVQSVFESIREVACENLLKIQKDIETQEKLLQFRSGSTPRAKALGQQISEIVPPQDDEAPLTTNAQSMNYWSSPAKPTPGSSKATHELPYRPDLLSSSSPQQAPGDQMQGVVSSPADRGAGDILRSGLDASPLIGDSSSPANAQAASSPLDAQAAVFAPGQPWSSPIADRTRRFGSLPRTEGSGQHRRGDHQTDERQNEETRDRMTGTGKKRQPEE